MKKESTNSIGLNEIPYQNTTTIFYVDDYKWEWVDRVLLPESKRRIVGANGNFPLWSLMLRKLKCLAWIYLLTMMVVKCSHWKNTDLFPAHCPSTYPVQYCNWLQTCNKHSKHIYTHSTEQDHFQLVVRVAMQTQGKFHRLLKEKMMNDTTAGRDYAASKITVETWTSPDEGKHLRAH